MNLQLEDLLTPVQIEQAHETLTGILDSIDVEHDQELTRVHRLFEERRRLARREAILKVLQGEILSVEMSVENGPFVEVIPAVDASPVEEDAPANVPVDVPPSYVLPQDDPVTVDAWQQEEADRTAIRLPFPEPMETLIEEAIAEVQEHGVGEIPPPEPVILTAPPKGHLNKASAANHLRISSNDFKLLLDKGDIIPSGEYEYRPGATSQYFSLEVLNAYIQTRKQKAAEAKAAREAAKASATSKINIASPKIALPDLIMQGKHSYPKGFFVGHHQGEDRLDVFGMPREMGLPAGWIVAAVVEPMVAGSDWTCHIPTTIGTMRGTAEQIKDIVMGPRKAGAE